MTSELNAMMRALNRVKQYQILILLTYAIVWSFMSFRSQSQNLQ